MIKVIYCKIKTVYTQTRTKIHTQSLQNSFHSNSYSLFIVHFGLGLAIIKSKRLKFKIQSCSCRKILTFNHLKQLYKPSLSETLLPKNELVNCIVDL